MRFRLSSLSFLESLHQQLNSVGNYGWFLWQLALSAGLWPSLGNSFQFLRLPLPSSSLSHFSKGERVIGLSFLLPVVVMISFSISYLRQNLPLCSSLEISIKCLKFKYLHWYLHWSFFELEVVKASCLEVSANLRSLSKSKTLQLTHLACVSEYHFVDLCMLIDFWN